MQGSVLSNTGASEMQIAEGLLYLLLKNNIHKSTISQATITPPIPIWYTNIKRIDDIIDFILVITFDSIGKILLLIDWWKGPHK